MTNNNGHGSETLVNPIGMRGQIPGKPGNPAVHPAWAAFIRLCQQIEFGELERLKLQDGLPVSVEVVRRKIKIV